MSDEPNEDDLRYIFTLDRIVKNGDGTCTICAPKASGRTLYKVSEAFARAFEAAKMAQPFGCSKGYVPLP